MSDHWKRIIHYCLAMFVLASCAAAPVTPTFRRGTRNSHPATGWVAA